MQLYDMAINASNTAGQHELLVRCHPLVEVITVEKKML